MSPLNEIVQDIYNVSMELNNIINDLNHCIVSHEDSINKKYVAKCHNEFANQWLKDEQRFLRFAVEGNNLVIYLDARNNVYLAIGAFTTLLQQQLHETAIKHMIENPDVIADFPEHYKYFKSTF
jgi:hypothetical protein